MTRTQKNRKYKKKKKTTTTTTTRKKKQTNRKDQNKSNATQVRPKCTQQQIWQTFWTEYKQEIQLKEMFFYVQKLHNNI